MIEILSAFLISFIIFYLLVVWIVWKISTCGEGTLIKFNSFEKFYAIAPSCFILSDHDICFVEKGQSLFPSRHYFKFSFFDWIKYRKFKRDLQRKESRQKDNKNYEILIKEMRKEIKKTGEQASQEFAQVIDTLQSLGEGKEPIKSPENYPRLVEMRPKQYYSSDPKELSKYCNQTFQ